MMCDFGTGNNNKLNWVLEDKQELIDIIETIYRGAKKGRGLVVSPKGGWYRVRRWAGGLRLTAHRLLDEVSVLGGALSVLEMVSQHMGRMDVFRTRGKEAQARLLEVLGRNAWNGKNGRFRYWLVSLWRTLLITPSC